jgi:hypothetical protein
MQLKAPMNADILIRITLVMCSIEKTPKIGGVACHTTELNLTSDVNDEIDPILQRAEMFQTA